MPLPTDPQVNLPAALRSQVANVESHYKKPDTAAAPEPPAAPPAAPPAPPVSADPPAAPAEPVVEPVKVEKPVDWEHSAKTWKGRAEKKDQALAAARDRISELESTLTAATRTQEPPRKRREESFKTLLTQDEIKDYGEDLLNVMRKVVKEEVTPIIGEIRGETEELKSKVKVTDQHVVQNAYHRMLQTLDTQCPKWRELNEDDEFLAWLGLPDQFSGVIRHELLKDAFGRYNASRVLAFFNGYLLEAAKDPASAELNPQPPAPAQGKAPVPQVQLEHLAAPGRAKSPAGSTPPAEKPFLRRSDITAFYTASAAGKYRDNPEEYSRIDKMIHDAQLEGRILP
jgi:hypothetical protein